MKKQRVNKDHVNPTEIFGHNPENFNNTRIEYPSEFIGEILRDVYHDSGLAPTNAQPCVIDMGAGTGKLGKVFLDMGCDVIFVEPNPNSSEYLRKHFSNNPHARIVEAKGEKTGLPDHCADIIVMGDASHWLSGAAAPEFTRVLKPGGQVASFARYWAPDNPVTMKLHRLLMRESQEYTRSTNKYVRDVPNIRRRQGHHLTQGEGGRWKGFGFIETYSKDELVAYFKGISSTTRVVERDEASFRKNVIQPLWESAAENDMLTPDGKLKVLYEVNALYGPPRKLLMDHQNGRDSRGI